MSTHIDIQPCVAEADALSGSIAEPADIQDWTDPVARDRILTFVLTRRYTNGSTQGASRLRPDWGQTTCQYRIESYDGLIRREPGPGFLLSRLYRLKGPNIRITHPIKYNPSRTFGQGEIVQGNCQGYGTFRGRTARWPGKCQVRFLKTASNPGRDQEVCARCSLWPHSSRSARSLRRKKRAASEEAARMGSAVGSQLNTEPTAWAISFEIGCSPGYLMNPTWPSM